MSAASIARRLAAAGLDAHAIVAALEAFEAADEERRAAKREGNKERQARRRARHAVSRDVTRDDALPSVTLPKTKVSPTPPSKTQPSNPSEPKGSSGRLPAHTREAARQGVEAFGRFWSAYPRKVAKPEALKAFAKALAKFPDGEGEAVIVGALERARACWRDAQFIPHPATWLNREPWNDEPETPEPTIVPLRASYDRAPPRPNPRDDRLQRALQGARLALDG